MLEHQARLGGLGAAVRPSWGAERLLPRSAGSGERLSPAPDPTASARQVTCIHAGSPGSPWHQPQRGGSAQPSSQGTSPSASPWLHSSSHRAWAAAPATPIPLKQPVSTSPFSLPFSSQLHFSQHFFPSQHFHTPYRSHFAPPDFPQQVCISPGAAPTAAPRAPAALQLTFIIAW